MTNYDRIKSMSVEEMAKIICKSENCEKICVFSKDGKCNAFGTNASICVEGCKQWLLQEVSDENITKIEHNSLCETKTYKNK